MHPPRILRASARRRINAIRLGVMKRLFLTLSALSFAASASIAAAAQPVNVQSLSVHLVLTPSGELSEDIAAMPGFSSWNFRALVPLKPLDEEFRSFLVKVRLESANEVFQKGQVGRVVVRSVTTRKVLFSSQISNVHIPRAGQTVIAKLVEGHVCEPVFVEASSGKSVVRKQISFQCGE